MQLKIYLPRNLPPEVTPFARVSMKYSTKENLLCLNFKCFSLNPAVKLLLHAKRFLLMTKRNTRRNAETKFSGEDVNLRREGPWASFLFPLVHPRHLHPSALTYRYAQSLPLTSSNCSPDLLLLMRVMRQPCRSSAKTA